MVSSCMQRWEFIKENKKIRKQEKKLSTKKATKKKEKKEENTLSTKKAIKKKRRNDNGQEKKNTLKHFKPQNTFWT